MAEPIIFGGSPLDEYLHDADQSQHRTFPDALDRTDEESESSTSGLGIRRTSTPRAASSIVGRIQESGRKAPTTSPNGALTALKPVTSPVDSPGMPERVTQSAHTNHTLETEHGPTSPLTCGDSQRLGVPSAQRQASPVDPAWEFAGVIVALIRRLLLPAVLAITHNLFGLRKASAVSSPDPQTANITKQSTSTNDTSDNASFAERFKHTVCSSFLLTPSLSISFYETNSPFQTLHTNQLRAVKRGCNSDHVRRNRYSNASICKQSYVEPADAPVSQRPRTFDGANERLPRLDTQGRLARNAAILSAVFLLPPISASWRLWLSTSLLIGCLTVGFVVFLGHALKDDKIGFTLSRRSNINASVSATSLRNLPLTQAFSRSEKKALQRTVLKDVSSLIRAAQHFDVSVNKAISAIQEVEIVSRGYKLTHPLPPISRIEAASGWSNVASPARPRRSIAASPGPASGKLGRSVSGGSSGVPPVRRHAQRPLSLNLSNGRMSPLDRPSGRASPAVSSEVGDVDLTQKLLIEQSTAALSTGRPAPQRLVELRKGIVAALDAVGATFTSTIESLQTIADAEEVALLHELYALDASPRDDANETEADASHAWSNADISALSEVSHDVEHDRKAWVATTPRNIGIGVRSAAEVGAHGNTSGRPDFSPQTGSTNHHKRLSLASDAGSILDRLPRASSSLSRRSSLVSESGNVGNYRSPRLNYVSDKTTGASGPNESAAAKRLSYVSNSNSSVTSPVMRNSSVLSSHSTPPHSSAQTYSAATSPQSRATKRASIVGPSSIFAQLDPLMPLLNRTEPVDALSLLSIKAKFEWMHRARRRWLCHLLALHLNMDGHVSLLHGDHLPCDEYWALARSTIGSAREALQTQNRAVAAMVTKEMGPDCLSAPQTQEPAGQGDGSVKSESRERLLRVPNGDAGTLSIIGHPGVEDRLHAMMLSLRSLQSKIRVCAEDIQVKPPSGLHGTEDGLSAPVGDPSEDRSDDAAAATAMQLEKTLESMRDDLLGLSAEWEATIKLVNKEKRRSPSPQPSIENEADVSKSNAARELESPLEADEDAADPSHGNNDEGQAFSDDGLPRNRGQAGDGEAVDASDDEDDSDLAALLLNSTSPNSLPPPGLEQVFESIAGMAGLAGLSGGASKLSRAERIEQTRRQRQRQEQDRQASERALNRHTMDPSGMMSELNDVISSRKAERDQRHSSALPLAAATAEATSMLRGWSAPSSGAQPALALGSPLDLGSAGHTGVFGSSPSFIDDQAAMPRRSMSSLDLARARALQALEARSPSAGSSRNSLDSGDESISRSSDDFSFEPTALESVPEDMAATSVLTHDSPSVWDSNSRKSTPKASHAPLGNSEATPVPDSPFDLGAQVAAYARRKKAAAAMQASGSESSVASHPSQ